ncbi:MULTISPECIES: glycosyltransferase family 87 protein [Sphingobium]|nr:MULTISPECIES: glycosyltransferase family 87 protein [Sphingobium]
MIGSSHQDARRSTILLLWICGTFLGPFLMLSDLMQLDGLRLSEVRLVIGRDFLNVWTAGQLTLSDKLALLYDYDGYRLWQSAIFGPLDPYNYSYPPHSLFLAMSFGALPYPIALLAWTLIGAGFFAWTARAYMPPQLSLWTSILTPAALVNIWAGHYGFVIGGMWLLFFSLLARFPGRAGAIAGLLTLKPHLGMLIAVTLLIRKAWRAIGVAVLVTAGLILASGAIFGWDLWRDWLLETSSLQTRILQDESYKFYFFMMPSAYVALRGLPMEIATSAQIAVAAFALWCVWKSRYVRNEELAFIAASATVLTLPYIFNYDLTVASLGFAVCLFGRWKQLNKAERAALWFGFAAPLLVMVDNLFAPASIAMAMFVQVRCATGRSPVHLSGLTRLLDRSRPWRVMP